MKSGVKLLALSVALALGGTQIAFAAKQQREEDSVYEWGRWAVLSPAAGGEPYVAAAEPDASNNIRPDGADEFSPKVTSTPEEPVIPPGPPTPPVTPPEPPSTSDPRDRLPPRASDPRDRLPPRDELLL